jgi:hypothetical protein
MQYRDFASIDNAASMSPGALRSLAARAHRAGDRGLLAAIRAEYRRRRSAAAIAFHAT